MTQRTNAPRVAVVTGATGGIGSAVCHRLSSTGWQVIGVDLVAPAAGTGVMRAITGDSRDPAVLEAAVSEARSAGVLHAWVNTVGALSPGPLDELDDGDIRSQLSVNLETVILGCRAAVREFLAERTPGSIVNIGSVHAVRPFPGLPLYAAAKGAIEALTRQLCVEYAGRGIRTVTIAPGAVETTMTTGADARRAADNLRAAAALSPMHRVSAPHEVAAAVDYLVSGDAVGINGTVIRLDNGISSFTIGEQ